MSQAMDAAPKAGRRRWLVVLAAVLVCAAAAAGFGIAKVTSQADQVGRATLLPPATATPATPGATPIVRPTRPAAAGNALNVLVVRKADTGSQADAFALVHVDDKRSRVDVLALDPKTAVRELGGATMAEEYATGGTPAAVSAAEQLTQVPVDHAAEMTKTGFDALRKLMSSGALKDPLAAQDSLDVVMQNVTVDESLDATTMRELAFDLAATGSPTPHSYTAADLADAAKLSALRKALQTDDLAAL